MLLMIFDLPSRVNVFNQCDTAFRLGDGPNVAPTGRPINNTQSNNTNSSRDIDCNTIDRGEAKSQATTGSNPRTYETFAPLSQLIPPVPSEATRSTPMQGPGVHPTCHAPMPSPMQGPGIAPASYVQATPTQFPPPTTPYVPVQVVPMQGPGVPPTTTSYVSPITPSPAQSAPSPAGPLPQGPTTCDADDNNATKTRAAQAARVEKLYANRFTNPRKMTPQPGLAAK
jgi:hypothetical protein